MESVALSCDERKNPQTYTSNDIRTILGRHFGGYDIAFFSNYFKSSYVNSNSERNIPYRRILLRRQLNFKGDMSQDQFW